jgi:uncharacterized protein YaaW (UPF0174 family)
VIAKIYKNNKIIIVPDLEEKIREEFYSEVAKYKIEQSLDVKLLKSIIDVLSAENKERLLTEEFISITIQAMVRRFKRPDALDFIM